MLVVEGLGKRYGDRWIFRGLSFQLNQGDRLVVVGQNGAGKSTLLRTIAGLSGATEGKLRLPAGDARLTVGLSALDQALYPHLSFVEHLDLVADLRGCPPRREELIERMGLNKSKSLPTSQLSTGMRARVRLALAIQADPKLLILDEPGASLDEAGRKLVDEVVEEQAQRGCVILATNDPQERRLANCELELVH